MQVGEIQFTKHKSVYEQPFQGSKSTRNNGKYCEFLCFNIEIDIPCKSIQIKTLHGYNGYFHTKKCTQARHKVSLSLLPLRLFTLNNLVKICKLISIICPVLTEWNFILSVFISNGGNFKKINKTERWIPKFSFSVRYLIINFLSFLMLIFFSTFFT